MCNPVAHPACLLQAPVTAAAGSVLDQVSHAITDAINWLVDGSATWWVKIPSPVLTQAGPIGNLQGWIMPIAAAVAVISMIAAGGKMALTRKPSPLINVGTGLLIIAATTALGVVLPEMLLRAGDSWGNWVLTQATDGQFTARLAALLEMPGAPAGVVLVLGPIAVILSAAQFVLMLFRQGAVVLLAGVLPLAAAGTLTALTRPWFRRVTGWMLALIFYKPAAAAVYATAFTMIGTGTDVRAVIFGFTMLLLSLVTLPVLMRFFTWATGTVEVSASGGGFLGAVIGGTAAVGALRVSSGGVGGMSAADQARSVSTQLGPPGADPAPPGSPRVAPGPGTPAGPGGGRSAAAAEGSTPAAPSPAASGARAAAAPAGLVIAGAETARAAAEHAAAAGEGAQ